MVDNLFITRGVIDHALYLGKELCITFFDIEKCFLVMAGRLHKFFVGKWNKR